MRTLLIISDGWNNFTHIESILKTFNVDKPVLAIHTSKNANTEKIKRIAKKLGYDIYYNKYAKVPKWLQKVPLLELSKKYFLVKEISPDRCIAFILNDNEEDTLMALAVEKRGIPVEVHRLYVQD